MKTKVQVTLRNQPGHDKLVSLRLQFLRDGTPIAPPVHLARIDVEEGKPPKTRFVTIDLPVAALEGEGPDVVMALRLTAVSH